MPPVSKPIVLGVDEDRAAQGLIAQTFNAADLFYRFITDRRKLVGGIRQLSPDLLLVFGELSSDFVIHVLDALSQDVANARLPVLVVCHDTSDAPFVSGMRTGVVGLLPRPFDSTYPGLVKTLWRELASRSGASSGELAKGVLPKLVEHLRRTRRTGLLLTEARTPAEGRASFVHGKLSRAKRSSTVGPAALEQMLALPSGQWTFNELTGHGEGAGVVIEVGEARDDATELEGVEVTVGKAAADEPLAFEVPVQPSPAPRPGPAAPRDPPVRVLLVDDDEAILRMLSTLFKKHGFAVVTALDGKRGAELALEQPFDAVLADLNMPHLDGWGMLRVLRDDLRTRELPVAFISAHDDYRESLRALNAGAQAYLSKGTRLDAIVTQVQKLLQPREAVLACLKSPAGGPLPIAQVGPQWILRRVAELRLAGALEARDGWAAYRLGFAGGTCVAAQATAGKYHADSERAFNAFVATRNAEGAWIPGAPPGPPNLDLSTDALIDRACAALNSNEQRIREQLMVNATQIDVNLDLYAVYQKVGPKQWLEAARLICEDKIAPREVIARLDISPIEIEETLRDLVRRGVISLK